MITESSHFSSLNAHIMLYSFALITELNAEIMSVTKITPTHSLYSTFSMGVVDVQVNTLSKQITGLKTLPVGVRKEIFPDNKYIMLQQGEWKI